MNNYLKKIVFYYIMYFFNRNHIYIIIIYSIIYFLCFTFTKDGFHINRTEEDLKNKNFNNIINSMYFSTITQSTMGYGDIYPRMWWSKLLVVSQTLLIIYHVTT